MAAGVPAHTGADDDGATGADFERLLASASPDTRAWLEAHATPVMRRYGHPAARWNEQIAEESVARMSAGEKWRHNLYAHGVLALVAGEFNGNKEGAVGEYPARRGQVVRDLGGGAFMYGPTSRAGSTKDYQGHNIAAIAVDPTGYIVGSAFNHNVLFSSTTQHAEQRLIDNLYARPDALVRRDVGAQGGPGGGELVAEDAMKELAVYTSLEPCQQCAGKLHLAGIPEVMYCQRDWDIELHLNAMYRRHFKTRPIPGWAVGFRPSQDLTLAFLEYRKAVEGGRVPFFRSVTGAVQYAKKSMPYFLCTDAAKAVFDGAAASLAALMTDADAEWAALPPDERDAIAAYRPGADLRGRHVKEDELAARRRELVAMDHERRCTVYIADELPPGGSEEAVEAALAPFGDIAAVNMTRDAATGYPRGPLFVQFATPAVAAAAAAAINGRVLAPWPTGALHANVSTRDARQQRTAGRIAQLERELAAPPAPPAPGTMSNAQALAHVRAYVTYERVVERRSTMRK